MCPACPGRCRGHARRRCPTGRLSIVVGGSGHYPAFGGLVGADLTDGDVISNVFTSVRRALSRLGPGSEILARPEHPEQPPTPAAAVARQARRGSQKAGLG